YAGYGRVARVCSPDVRAAGGLESCRVIFLVKEIVVALRIGAQFRIVVERAERQGRAAAPPPHHLSCQQFLVLPPAGVRLQVLAERRYTLVQFAENNIGPVAAQALGLSYLDAADLVSIAQNEFACHKGLFPGIGSRNAAPFDRRMTDAVSESEGLRFG